MPADNALRTALKRFMKEHDLSVFAWATASGVPESTLRSFFGGKKNKPRSHDLHYDTLLKLARSQQVTVAEMLGERPRIMKPGADSVVVKGMRVTARMGGGVPDIDYEPEGNPFYFRRNFVESIGSLEHLRMIELSGDSNEPTIANGDVGMVHLNKTNPTNDSGFYAVWDGNGLVIKRVQIIPGAKPKLRLISDNKAYPPYDVDIEGARIIGRLVWIAGMI